MSYFQFHCVFTIPLLLGLLFYLRKNPSIFSHRGLQATGLLVFLALSYTTPWDSYLIRENIWTYEAGRVLGTLFHIPFEEYFFFVIQTIIACLWTSVLYNRLSPKTRYRLDLNKMALAVGLTLFPVALWAFLQIPELSPWRYLALIVVWAVPVLMLQWLLGIGTLLKEWKTWVGAVVSLTLYFWAADTFAIWQEIWLFPEGTISDLHLFSILPIEEALFFLVTNLMVVQGYILFTCFDFSALALNTHKLATGEQTTGDRI